MIQTEEIRFADEHGSDVKLHRQIKDLSDVYSKRETISIPKKCVYEFFKRIFDFVFSTLAFIILFPFLLITALIIFIDDPHGSPIYVSKRCGKNGKEFRFYKFRSMCANADTMLDSLMDKNEADGPAFKIKDDPRITRVGRIIRKCSIDELPQLLNIIKGDMSIVGPRPPIPHEVAQYTAYQMQRLQIKPGLTCFWQVRPNRNDIPFNEWVALDLQYIERRSFILDCKIIFRTLRAIFSNYGV